MTRVDDDQLLDRLGASLAQPPAEPTSDEIDAVRALVAHRELAGVLEMPRDHVLRTPVRRVLVAAVVVVGLVALSGLVALGAGAPVPRALRTPARALGLPVDSPALADVRSAMADVRAALAGTDDRRLAATRDHLVLLVGHLDVGDRAEVAGDVHDLLERVAARLVDDGTAQRAHPAPAATSATTNRSGSGSATPVTSEPPDSRLEDGAPGEENEPPSSTSTTVAAGSTTHRTPEAEAPEHEPPENEPPETEAPGS